MARTQFVPPFPRSIALAGLVALSGCYDADDVVSRPDLEPLEAQAALYLRYFPVEANLPTDPETGWYVWNGKPWEPVRAPTREDVLERWPLFS